MKFRSDVDGFITGIRFYKGAGNTGTHVGNLWSASGAAARARATFTDETAHRLAAGDLPNAGGDQREYVYVASYFAPNGRYAGDGGLLRRQRRRQRPIHLLADGASGGNGVYRLRGPAASRPSTYQATNYWVDVVFSTDRGPTRPLRP